MRKITPSKQKFRDAKTTVKRLAGILGTNIKSAFVCGSVAANMALPTSDTDLILVLDRIQGTHQSRQSTLNELMKRKGIDAGSTKFLVLDKREFESLEAIKLETLILNDALITGHFAKRGPNILLVAKEMLSHGALPVFGKEYAQQHQRSWKFPDLSSIRRRYAEETQFQLKRNESASRLRFKPKGRIRFQRK